MTSAQWLYEVKHRKYCVCKLTLFQKKSFCFRAHLLISFGELWGAFWSHVGPCVSFREVGTNQMLMSFWVPLWVARI